MRRVGVVGAGIVGVQLARMLQIRGANVILFDNNEPGSGTSFGNAGYIATDEILPLAHSSILKSLPSILFDPLGPVTFDWRHLWSLTPWVIRYLKACTGNNSLSGIETLANLQRSARPAWEEIIAREKVSELMRKNGSFKIFETEEGFKRTRTERLLQRQYDIEWELVEGSKLRDQVPELTANVKHAIYYPNGMHTVSPIDLTEAIFINFLKDGGSFVKAKVERIGLSGDGQPSLLTQDKKWALNNIVISAGYTSEALLKPLGLRVPLIAERGYHVEMEYDELSFEMSIGSYERGCYLTPMRSGLRVAGTSELVPVKLEGTPNWPRAQILAKHAKKLLPGVYLSKTREWMGRRPTLPDFLPMLGPVPGNEGIFVACGHHHLGLTLSAVTADIMSKSLLEKDFTAIPHALRADRFNQ